MPKLPDYPQAVKDNLVWSLEDFSDFERSRSEWRGLNPQVRRSYDEDIALFFQTYQAQHFALGACRNLGFDDLQCAQFRRFVDALSNYDQQIRRNETVDSELVIRDPDWQEIVSLALQTLQHLRNSDV